MPMRVGFLMDSLESMKIEKDTSYALMKAGLGLDFEIYHFLLSDLSLEDNQPHAEARRISGMQPDGHLRVEKSKGLRLNDLDAIWIRKEPPFDRKYFYSTLFLDFLEERVFVVNDPKCLRDWNEKLAALEFTNWTPKTLISCDKNQIQKFVSDTGKSVLKPLDGFGGKGIVFVEPGQSDLDQVIDHITHDGSHWIVANEFVADSHLGDKRIILVEGEPIGAILRKSETGGLHNMDQGGKALPAELNETDLAVCKALKPELLKRNVFFVGIDMLGTRLTEINVTSPTGIQELSRFSGIDHPTNVMKRLAEICAERN